MKNYVSFDNMTQIMNSVASKFNSFSSDLFNMVSDEFDTTAAYVSGNVVIYNGRLYKFKADHAAGAWNPSEVDAITIEDLIASSAVSELTPSQVNGLIDLLD